MSEQARYCSVFEVAERLGVHPQTVRSMIDRGELSAIRIGKARSAPYRVLIASIEQYEAAQSVTAGA